MKLKLNTVKVGQYKLTVSMATLAFADRELKAREKKPVLEMFSAVVPAFKDFQTGNTDFKVDLDGIDFEAFTVVMWCFLKPANDDFDYEEALEGPLMVGSPQDWLTGVFSAIVNNHDTAENDDEEPEGNAKAA